LPPTGPPSYLYWKNLHIWYNTKL